MVHSTQSPRLASASILGVLIGFSPLAATAQGLAYQWQPGQKFSYQVDVVVDGGDETITYTGVIHYTVNSADGDQASVTYRGGLSESKKSKQRNDGRLGPFGPRGFGGPPSFPSPFSQPTFAGKTQTTNKITITRRGETLAMEGDSQLPYLLGNVSLMPFEPLPAGNEQQWKYDSGVSITEKSDNDRHPFGAFGPFGPLAGNDKTNVQAASEVSGYAVQRNQGDLVVVQKTYRLNTPSAGDRPAFEMVGEGTWSFDTKEHVPQACDMKLSLNVKQDNTSTLIPISVKYNRLSAEKVAEMEAAAKNKADELAKAAAEKKAMAEAPLTEAEKGENLSALSSDDAARIQQALDRLAGKSPQDPDPQVAAAIEKHLASSNDRVARAAQNAMTKWSPGFALRMKLKKDYQGPAPLKSSDLVVESITPLYVGQIVQAHQPNRGPFWFAAKVKKLLPDGQVELGFLTWGKETNTAVVKRSNMQLAEAELEQPEQPAAMPTAKGQSRTWTDTTGRFKVDAEFISVSDGKVNLRRADGRTLSIPLDKLSDADRAHVKGMEEADNPFQLN